MYRYVALILTAFICSAFAGTEQIGAAPRLDGRIVGGRDADISTYPHQISMRYNGRHRCGGSIVSQNLILSAAHCVVGLSSADGLTIVAGNTLLSDKSSPIEVLKFIIHENYKTSNNDYDVAILILRGLLTFNQNIQPIGLAKERPPAGTEVIVTGWGTLVEGGSIPDQLQQVIVSIVSNTKCSFSYTPALLTGRMICAGVPQGGKDACQGDSGGPLINAQGEQLGIVSWGIGCARPNFPGVYASVPELRDWILETMKANEISWA